MQQLSHSSVGQAPTGSLPNWVWYLLGLLFMVLILVIRIKVFYEFNLQVIDSDQPYMWLGAADYAKGIFMEPRYYGQDYNTFMEALFAVPLVWLGLPVYKALPIASDFISLFPFFFAASYLFAKGFKVQALVVLSVLLCLPVSYDMICSMPRGFVTGIFFASFFIVSLVNPHNRTMLVLNTVFAVLGYFVSPNSVVLSLPFLFYLFTIHYRNKHYYKWSAASILLSLPVCYLVFDRFYRLHPDYVMNDLTLRFSSDYFPLAMAAFPKFFKQLCFFWEGATVLFFVVFLAITFLLLKSKSKFMYAMLLFLVFLFVSFCFGKTQDGSEWLFMPRSRMYLGLPLLLALGSAHISLRFHRKWLLLLLAVVVNGCIKLTSIQSTFQQNEPLAQWTGVRLIPLKDAIHMVKFYGDACQEARVDFLLVSNKFWMNTLLVYGGPALFKDYPQTLETYRDKRYWARESHASQVHRRLVVVSSNFDLDKQVPQGTRLKIKRLDDYGLFLIEENTYNTRLLCNLISAYEN